MGAFLAVVGFLAFLVSFILLIVNAVKKKPVKKIGIALLITFLVFIVGIAISPSPEETAGPPGDQPGLVDGEADELDVDNPGEDADNPSDEEPDKEPGGDKTPPAATAPSGQMKVHFINVGQGDAILIQTPSQNILIDGGNRDNTALNYIRSQGVTSLDLVIGTHPHADHIGGLINVMQSIPVKEVIDPGVVHTTKTFEDYLTIIDQKDIKFTEGRAGMTRDLGGGARMQILHPSSPSASHLNNASVVARVTFGSVSLLFTGDAESAAESQILGRGYTLDSTIMKVGHHGSRTSATNAFLNAVKPKAAIIMCGSGNQYGHPHEETLQKLTNAKVDIFRTDIHGTIIITTDGSTYTVNKQPYQYKPTQTSTGSGSGGGSTTQPPPSQSEPEPEPKPDPKPDPAPSGKVNINTASFEDLQLIIHIGPARAQEIIDKRPFNSVDDLTRVSGIGPARLADIKNQGIAYVP